MKKKKYKIGYTAGVFDLFHIGHLNILKKAKEQCEFLIVGVSKDELVQSYKNKTPVIPYEARYEIVNSIKYVDKVIPQTNRNKIETLFKYKFDVMFVGSDWQGSDDWEQYEKEFAEYNVDINYLSYTEGISSTMIIEAIRK